MYETTVIALIFLMAGSLAAPASSKTGNQDVTIEESSYHKSGNQQVTQRNTTQHRVPGHVDIIVVQGNSNKTRDETGKIKKVHLNGTAGGSNPININNGGDGFISDIESTTNSPDDGEGESTTTTSVEASSTITNPNNGGASTTTDSDNYDAEDVTRSDEDTDASVGSDDGDDDDNDSSGSTVSRNGEYTVPTVVDFIDPYSTSSSSSREEHDDDLDETGED